MAISIVGGAPVAGSSLNGANAAFTWPTLAQGDVCYVMGGRGSNGIGTITGSGWVQLLQGAAGGGPTATLWRKVQGSTPDTTCTMLGGSDAATGTALVGIALRGVNTTTPEDANAVLKFGSGQSPNPDPITVVTPGSAVLVFAGINANDSTFTDPSGYSAHVGAIGADTSPYGAWVCYKLNVAAGVEDPGNFTGVGGAVAATNQFTVAVRVLANIGTFAATEAQDTADFTGTDTHVQSGALAVTEVGDGLIAYGNHAHLGTLAVTEAQDSFAGVGTHAHLGTFAATETPDGAYLWNPHNIAFYSEQFDNAYWNKRTGLTVVADNTVAPDGTTTADRAVWASGDGYLWHTILTNAYRPGTTYTVSMWAKVAAGSPTLQFHADWGGGSPTNVSSSVISPTSSWVRYEFTFTTTSPTGAGGDAGFYIVSGELYLWGVQLVFGDAPLPYAKTVDVNYPVPTGVVVAGPLAATEAQDALAATGAVRPYHFGALAATEAKDTFVASGSAFKLTTGTLVATEAQDDFDAEGTDSGVGVMAAVESQDIFAGVGTHTHLGTFAATEAQDVFACLAQIVRHVGTMAVTEAADVGLFGGQVNHHGVLAVTEAPDTFASSGDVLQVQGTLDATDEQDVALFVGQQLQVNGPLDVTEAQDAFAGDGLANGVRYGVLDATEAQDAFYAVGYSYGLTAGLPDAVAKAEGQQLSVEVEPEFDLTAEIPTLDLAADAQTLTGDASATPQSALRYSVVDLVINQLYSAIMPLNPVYRDVVDVGDDVVVSFDHAFTESVHALDAIAIDRARTSTEAVVALDAYALAVVWVRLFSERVAVQDAIHVLAPSGSIFSDSVFVAELMARAVAIQRGDPVPIADHTSAALIPRPSETASATDAMSRVVAYRRTFGDAAIMVEQMAIATTKLLTTPVSVADQKLGGWGKALADNLFTADVQRRVLGKGLADGPTVTDASSVSVAFRRTFSDVVFATDIFSTITNDLVQFTDSVTMSDARVRALTKPHIESVTLTDGRALSFGKRAADTVALASAGTIVGQGYANNYFAQDYVSGTLATFT